VVKVLDVGRRFDGRPFIVIEYLEGEALGDRVRRCGRLPLPIALSIARDAARGLHAVHQAGIVHRDVKPDNIFLVGDPNGHCEVRLVDFGLAKLHAHGKPSQTGATMGTAAYMAPEQVLSEEVHPCTDVYSLGVVLFRLVTGHLPFETPKDLDMLAHQVLLPAPPPSWFVEGLDGTLDAVVQRAMRKRPENRYRDMAAFADDLDRLLGSDGMPQQPPMAREPDIYQPMTELGRKAALLFCRTLGVSPPDWE